MRWGANGNAALTRSLRLGGCMHACTTTARLYIVCAFMHERSDREDRDFFSRCQLPIQFNQSQSQTKENFFSFLFSHNLYLFIINILCILYRIHLHFKCIYLFFLSASLSVLNICIYFTSSRICCFIRLHFQHHDTTSLTLQTQA